MKNRINRIARKLIAAVLITGLTTWLSLPAAHLRSTASAQTTNKASATLPAAQGEQAIEQIKEQGLYDSLQEAVAAARYELRWEAQPALRGLPPAYHAANPAQRVSAWFTPHELQLAPLDATPRGAAWRAALRFAGYGYAERLWPVGEAELVAAGDRIEYQRAGAPVVEWYINQPAGLEQGFTLTAPPGGKLAGERLRLAFDLSGDLRAELVEEGRAIALRQPDGELALRYGGLYVTDARGRELPSQMRVVAGQVWLEADDEGAVYPVTVDPTFGLPVKLTASDGAANDSFGNALALSGDTLVVGALNDRVGSNNNQGSVYAFVRSGGVWSEQAKLTASDGAAGANFGGAVALSGDTLVVGADADHGAQGAVYVFVRNAGVWSEQAKLTASNGSASDRFGQTVAIHGDTLVVGAPNADVSSIRDQGAAYVFVRRLGYWSEQQRLFVNGGGTVTDNFGCAVAISGDTIVVGVFRADVGLNLDQGAAYVFIRNGTVWLPQAYLTAHDGAALDFFGKSVAISADTIVVGASGDNLGSNQDQGSAYVFVRNGTAWTEQDKLNASDGAGGDNFGDAAAISGDTIIVGALLGDIGANLNQGAAYLFVRQGSAWTPAQKISASDGATNDAFGIAVSISGNNVAVGALLDDIGANANQGSAYVFTALWSQKEIVTAVDGTTAAHFGNAVSINGSTFVVGAAGDNANQGAAYVYLRSSFGTQQTKLTASDGAATDAFGSAVAICNDTIVVGAPYDDLGANANQGSVYVFVRSGGVWTQHAKLTAGDGTARDYFGRAVAVYEDSIVVGAPGDDVGANADQGSAYVFTRSAAAWTQTSKLIAKGASQDAFGSAVALSGETAIVGASGSNSSRGAAYVFVRGGDAWIQVQKLTASDGAAGNLFGDSVAISGNTVVVGAPKGNVGANQAQGTAYVFVGAGNAWTPQAKLTASDGAAYDQFGGAVAIYEDTIVVGAFDDDIGANTNQGSAYVFACGGGIWIQTQKLTGKDGAAYDKFGRTVAIHRNTLLVGAPDDDIDFSQDRGSAYVFGLP